MTVDSKPSKTLKLPITITLRAADVDFADARAREEGISRAGWLSRSVERAIAEERENAAAE
jgi:hypothetical protein